MANQKKSRADILAQTNFQLLDWLLHYGLNIPHPDDGDFMPSPLEEGVYRIWSNTTSPNITLGASHEVNDSGDIYPLLTLFDGRMDNFDQHPLRTIAIFPDLTIGQRIFDYQLEVGMLPGVIPLQDDMMRDVDILVTVISKASEEFVASYAELEGLDGYILIDELGLPPASDRDI